LNPNGELILNNLLNRLSDERILDPNFTSDKSIRRNINEFAKFLLMLFENKEVIELLLKLMQSSRKQMNRLGGDDLGLKKKDADKSFVLLLEKIFDNFILTNPDAVREIVQRINR
jgi:hypothetical protein